MRVREGTYYDIRTLHFIFALSSLFLLVCIILMIWTDNRREWRLVQQDFLKMQAVRYASETKRQNVQDLSEKIATLERRVDELKSKIGPKLEPIKRKLRYKKTNLIKLERDLEEAKRKLNELNVRAYAATRDGRKGKAAAILKQAKVAKERVHELRYAVERIKVEINKHEEKIRKAETPIRELQRRIKLLQRARSRLEARRWRPGTVIRDWPIIDALAPATRIEQIVLRELGMDYAFRIVPRYDRCITCHKGIDAVGPDGEPLYTPEVVSRFSNSRYRRAFYTHPRPDLFVTASSPHPKERFGCTICHEGQGSATDFNLAAHTPKSIGQESAWRQQFKWHPSEHWPYKMLPAPFIEAACLKCHPLVTDLEASKFGNVAPKLVRGFYLVQRHGCFACHDIQGYSNGRRVAPHLPRLLPGVQPREGPATYSGTEVLAPAIPGPSLRRIAEKVSENWLRQWIKAPDRLRPHTRMPRYYGLTNNSGGDDEVHGKDAVYADVEIIAMAHYLAVASSRYTSLASSNHSDRLNAGDTIGRSMAIRADALGKKDAQPGLQSISQRLAQRAESLDGKELFLTRGCLACHTHEAFDPNQFPNADQTFGPDLSDLRIKLRNAQGDLNVKWLFNWILNPSRLSVTTIMPQMQLADEEALAIARWLLEYEPQHKAQLAEPLLNGKALDELVYLYLARIIGSLKAKEAVKRGLSDATIRRLGPRYEPLRAPITEAKKLEFLGAQTIARLGCYGCHDIPGFENGKPNGPPLSDWGKKARLDTDQLDFGHVAQLVEKQVKATPEDACLKFLLRGLKRQTGLAYLWQLLRAPRSFDYLKPASWLERLRMPRPQFADDPEAVEAVVTFILGLTNEIYIPDRYRNLPTGLELQKIIGLQVVRNYNCEGCHVFRMPLVAFSLNKISLPELSALRHEEEYDTVANWQKQNAKDGALTTHIVAARGMLIGPDVLPLRPDKQAEQRHAVLELWEPVRIGGTTFFVGDRIALFELDAIDVSHSVPAQGGAYAELLAWYLSSLTGKMARDEFYRCPPPLTDLGERVNPAWLYQYLLQPFKVRPTVELRMPKFKLSRSEAAALVGFFMAQSRDSSLYSAESRYGPDFIRQQEQKRPGYFRDAWRLLTSESKEGKLCISCHNAGEVRAEMLPEERGADLWLAQGKFRSEWLLRWLLSPRRVLPYTLMPRNFTKTQKLYQDLFPGSSFEQAQAVCDALINYVFVHHMIIRATGERAIGADVRDDQE